MINARMIMKYGSQMMWEEEAVAKFEVLCKNFHGRPEETHKKLRQQIQSRK
jgi:hypothetical protein